MRLCVLVLNAQDTNGAPRSPPRVGHRIAARGLIPQCKRDCGGAVRLHLWLADEERRPLRRKHVCRQRGRCSGAASKGERGRRGTLGLWLRGERGHRAPGLQGQIPAVEGWHSAVRLLPPSRAPTGEGTEVRPARGMGVVRAMASATHRSQRDTTRTSQRHWEESEGCRRCFRGL